MPPNFKHLIMEGIKDIEYCSFYISENEKGLYDIYDCNNELLGGDFPSVKECERRIDEEYEINGYHIQQCTENGVWNIYDGDDNYVAGGFDRLDSAQAHIKYEL